MKSLQKRYIYAGLLGGIGFLITFLFLNINIFISLFITLIVYVGGVFFFKEKDVREYNADDINKYYFQTSKLLSYKDRVKDKAISDLIVKITDTSSKILAALTQKPKKVTQVYNFFDYYLPLSNAIVDKYLRLLTVKDMSNDEKVLFEKVDDYLLNISNQFDKQLENMYKVNELNVQEEIKIFEKACTIQGLDDNKVGETND